MTELTRAQIFREFRARAKDDPADAVDFFKRSLLPGPTLSEAQSQFFTAVNQLATSYDGASYQTPQPFEKTLARITDSKIRLVMADMAVTLLTAPHPAEV